MADMAAATLPRAPIAGIGRYHVGDQLTEFPIGWPEVTRDTAWARQAIAGWGIDQSSTVLVTAAMWQGPWMSPVLQALRGIGATFGMAESFGWDVRRTVTFARRLRLSMVFGIGRETAQALANSGQVSTVLGTVPAILAYRDAHPVLTGAGLRPGLLAFLGPALAVECPERDGAHVNRAEWQVDEAGGSLYLTTVGQRAYQAARVPVGAVGSVALEQCACGSLDPRVRLR
jgi:hypothetical protein